MRNIIFGNKDIKICCLYLFVKYYGFDISIDEIFGKVDLI